MSIVLDNVASGVDEDFKTPGSPCVIMCTAGAATLSASGDAIEEGALSAGDSKTINGFPAGTTLNAAATSAGTTVKVY